MPIEVRRRGKVVVLDCVGKLTIGEGDVQLREKVAQLLGEDERRFIFNMQRISFMDSSAIGETVGSRQRIREHGGEVKLVLPEEGKAREVFVITGLDRAFDISTDEDEAVNGFSL
jgi:anti-anti-sigma factor